MSTNLELIPIAERPYEKLERSGAAALGDAELLAVILRTGSRNKSALDLARSLILNYRAEDEESGLAFLSDLCLEELRQIEGIGRVKALQLSAAAEIGKRSVTVQTQARRLLNSPERVADYISADLRSLPREQLIMLILDTKQRLIRQSRVSEGGLASVHLQPRDLLREAVKANAAGIVLVHNHPSGDPTPSRDDIVATKSLIDASKLIGISLQDHIVVGHEGYVSIRQITNLWS